MASVWTVVVAAGTGQRFGGAKQFAPLAGRSVLDHAVATARSVTDGVVVVVPEGAETPPGVVAVTGGPSRSASVRNGLAAVPDDVAVVLVHDGARPLASADLFRRVIDAVTAGADGAIPALPVTDTVKRVDGQRVVGTVDRTDLVAVQTPQGFAAARLRAAYADGGAEATDDAALVEAAGGTVVWVAGEAANLKITEPGDLDRAAALLESARG